jgi:predicted HD phosphohydrolase
MGDYGVVNHEGIGAKYLQGKGFSERVCAMVGMHVQAKRYLVSTDVTYHAKLSEASLQTLKLQGGAMSEGEAETFEKLPFFRDIIKVRLWDEEAKDPNGILVPLSYFRTVIFEYLNKEHL